jgi:REP element-mobilizing transposase RayT
MPSIKTITPLLGGHFYHIFNRGINHERIFYQSRNYLYFLKLFQIYLMDFIDVWAYCLLPNHFHLIVKVKDEITIPKQGMSSLKKDDIPAATEKEIITDEAEIGKIVSNRFRSLFITFSMAINNQENRNGNLFDRTFKRLEITSEEYLEYAIFYVHYNPEKHGVASDFSNYNYSSYKAIVAKQKPTKLKRDNVIELYGGYNEFLNYHHVMHDEREAVILE